MLSPIKVFTLFVAYTNPRIIYAYSVQDSSTGKIQFYPSHDAFLRKDRKHEPHGDRSKITITQQGATQRIGLMKFDTADYDEDNFVENNIRAYLQLGVAEAYENAPVTVKIMIVDNDFHENYVTWNNFDGDAEKDNYVRFTINHQDHVNKVERFEVSNLLYPGKDTVLAFVVENSGYVKFHSKENKDSSLSPSLVLTAGDEL